MPLERIRVDGLRILENVDCRLHAERNYFFGPNGAGKTSLLEAVYLLGRGRSFRTRHTRRLIRHGRERLSVLAEHRAGDIQHTVAAGVDSTGVTFRMDREPVASVTPLARLFRVDVIDPGVHRLIEAGPSERRRFLDWAVFHVEPRYLDAWKGYRRVLGQRNAALKSGAASAALTPWNRALIDAAEAVHAARSTYVERLAASADRVAERLLGRGLTIGYRPGWRGGVTFAAALAEASERDRASGHTQVGPHRADLSIVSGGTAVADDASRGQQKLVAATLVIAQILETTAVAGRDSVLLVDDPAAELDRASLERLLREIEALPCQLILTGLSADLLPVDPRFPVFHVEQGRVEQ